MKMDFDCIVIGGGPGGIVSSIYLRRFRRRVALVNTGDLRALWIPKTHNLIGYDKGITGQALMKRLRRQINQLGVERFRAQGEARRVAGGFAVRCGDETIRAPKIIFATGIRDVLPEIESLKRLRCSPLLGLCPICDAYEHCGDSFAVLARDAAGIRKALFMQPFARKLRIILSMKTLIPPQLRRQIRAANAELLRGTLVDLKKNHRQGGVTLLFSDRASVRVDVLYCELGSVVNDAAFVSLRGLHRNRDGRLLTDREQRLSIPGAFAVGDCTHALAQLSVAAAQGAVAATQVHNELRKLRLGK